jgi:hypothetical protein
MRAHVLLLCASLLAACGETATVASTPSVAPADGAIPWSPRLASPTPSPAPTPALAACRPEDVAASFEGFGAATGNIGGSFRLSPRTDAACGLPANPASRFVDARGDRILPRAAPASEAPAVPLVRPSGKSSTFVSLQWSNHGGDPGWSCRTRSSDIAALEIHSGAQWIALPFAAGELSLCVDPPESVFVHTTAPEPPAPPRPEPIFEARIIAPSSARPGERLRYLVELTNRTTATQRFGECPAYVQNIAGPQELGSSDKTGFRYVERRQILNCAGLGDIAPGATMTFEMYFEIPTDALPGSYVLPWRLDGPLYSTGYKVGLEVRP